MRTPTLPVLGAAVLGAVIATGCFALWTPKPASAQLGKNTAPNLTGLPSNYAGPTNSFTAAIPQPPQPLEVQGLGPDHFVVATREPRLVTQDGKSAQNMLLTVVTYYTVREGRLIPIEHVKTPVGYQLVTVEP